MKKILFLIATVFVIQGCELYPDDEFRLDELDIVLTYYDVNANFDEYSTYILIDSIGQASDDTTGLSIVDPISDANNDYVLSVIETNMDALNYVKVQNAIDADLAVSVGVVTTTNIVVTPTYPSYWYGYGGGWYDPGYWYGYPSYGYGYPYYPSATVSSYDSGTLLIDLVDLKNFAPSTDEELPVVWSGIVRGVLESTTSELKTRVKTTIDQAFEQSPYLGN